MSTMKLQDIFDQLSVGEFSQLSIGGEAQGTINEDNWDKVIPHVNLALTQLYTRFNLKEGRITVALQEEQLVYPLTSYYAVSARRGATTRYIMDSVSEPFTDDMVKIEKIQAVNASGDYTADQLTFSLNDATDVYSITTPTMTTLRVPEDVIIQADDLPEQLLTDELLVIYRALHPKIIQSVGTCLDPCRVAIELPATHLAALLYYVAGRVHNPVGMANEFNAANNYMARYEAECQTLEGKGVQIDVNGGGNDRIQRGGWV